MAKVVDTPLVRELVRLMAAQQLMPQTLSKKAGLGSTYIRDLIEGRARSPLASKLVQVAHVLGVEPGTLLRLAGLSQEAEVVADPAERLLLFTWRQLAPEERKEVLSFIEFRLSARDKSSSREDTG